jgi:MFS transporter, PPP family, 3-phenylpropionic acid transporter
VQRTRSRCGERAATGLTWQRGNVDKGVVSPSAAPIAAYYLVLCGAMGLYLPYLSLYLSSVGLSDAAAVRVQAVIPFMSLLVPPLLGFLADARHLRIWLLRGLSAAAALLFAMLTLAGDSAVAIAVVLAAFALARSPLLALTDATAHEHVRHHGGSYGRLRIWGSIGYLLATLLAGALYDATSIGLMVWTTTAAFGVLVVCAQRMAAAAPRREPGMLDEIRRLLRTRSLWLFLAAIAVGHMPAAWYDTTLALHLAHLGYGKDFLGLVIAVGVAAETVLIAASSAILARFRSEHLLVAAFAIGALRWLVLSMVTSRAAILAQAPLHAFSFGLYWISATMLMREYAGPRATAAGQGLLASAIGIGSIVANLNGGALLERGGGQLLYSIAAGLAATAAVLAVLHAQLSHRK